MRYVVVVNERCPGQRIAALRSRSIRRRFLYLLSLLTREHAHASLGCTFRCGAFGRVGVDFAWNVHVVKIGTPGQGTCQERILPMRDSFATDEARNRTEDYAMVGFAHS
jgi:hypothetical protein